VGFLRDRLRAIAGGKFVGYLSAPDRRRLLEAVGRVLGDVHAG
jgi:hypothetical protein